MFVPLREFDPYIEYDAVTNGYHSGNVSGWMERGEESKRPIGFRMQKSEPLEPTSPEGLLL